MAAVVDNALFVAYLVCLLDLMNEGMPIYRRVVLVLERERDSVE